MMEYYEERGMVRFRPEAVVTELNLQF